MLWLRPLASLASLASLAVLCWRQSWIPYVLTASDLMASLGSGMTIKFFPLFFKETVKLDPIRVQAKHRPMHSNASEVVACVRGGRL